jgi:alkanesulfonate monooxygenase SsuD/methylene tetrahydromethanopterin reductase-like flavin-dependent oxidoreductase (luciferase family)
VAARRGIYLAPFGELSEPGVVAELAARAEERGWDGFFLWDHVAFHRPVRAIADPWVTLAAMAVATQRLVLGPLVTPVARRRPHKLARETVTLDRLSRGRLVLGVGLGWDRSGEFDPDRYGEEPDPRARARLLDEGLDRLLAYWGGDFKPRPVQLPRIPVWVAAGWPHRRPLRRAARFEGVFPIDLPGPEALAALASEVRALRGSGGTGGFDFVVTNPPGTDVAPWVAAGATWCLTGLGSRASVAKVRSAIDAYTPPE